MKVDLDIFEMSYLLDCCLRGSHLRSRTIERFVDEWYDKFTEQERYNLYEWTLRLTYSYKHEFQPSDNCCGADIDFMCRYDPENQYIVHTVFDGKKCKVFAYKKDSKYYVESNKFIADEYIKKVEKYIPKVERTDFEMNFKGRRH